MTLDTIQRSPDANVPKAYLRSHTGDFECQETTRRHSTGDTSKWGEKEVTTYTYWTSSRGDGIQELGTRRFLNSESAASF
jgi:hypothetical protein